MTRIGFTGTYGVRLNFSACVIGRFANWTIIMNTEALPENGFLRLKSILAPIGPIPVSKSTWWAGVKDGRFPQPLKLGKRVTVWRAEDIRKLIEKGAA